MKRERKKSSFDPPSIPTSSLELKSCQGKERVHTQLPSQEKGEERRERINYDRYIIQDPATSSFLSRFFQETRVKEE